MYYIIEQESEISLCKKCPTERPGGEETGGGASAKYCWVESGGRSGYEPDVENDQRKSMPFMIFLTTLKNTSAAGR